MGALAANVAVGVAILLAGLSLLLMVVGLVSYARMRHPRLIWVTVAFAAFAAQGLYLAWDAFHRRADLAQQWDALPTLAAVNLGIVIALYLAVLK